MAGSDPFRTGNTAFRLGLAKALVPFVFVFSPSLLIVAKGFTPYDFAVTFIGCILGITLLAAALSKFLLVEMTRGEQWLCRAAALLMIAPGLRAHAHRRGDGAARGAAPRWWRGRRGLPPADPRAHGPRPAISPAPELSGTLPRRVQRPHEGSLHRWPPRSATIAAWVVPPLEVTRARSVSGDSSDCAGQRSRPREGCEAARARAPALA
jgi:hypothetical protein